MAQSTNGRLMSLAELVQQNKLSTNHELPSAENLDQTEKQSDDAILTLLFADDPDAISLRLVKLSWF